MVPPRTHPTTPLTGPLPFRFAATWSALYPPLPKTKALERAAAGKPARQAAFQGDPEWSMVVPKMYRPLPRRRRPAEIAAPAAAPAILAHTHSCESSGDTSSTGQASTRVSTPHAKCVRHNRHRMFWGSAAAAVAAVAAVVLVVLPHFQARQRVETVLVSPPEFSHTPEQPPQPVAQRSAPKQAKPKRFRPPPISAARSTRIETPPDVRAAEPNGLRVLPIPVPSPPSDLPLSSGFESCKAVKKVKPIYPEMARVAQVQGTVRLKAKIGRDGEIQRIDVESGPPLLIEAAKEAVLQWTFEPAVLDGDPVEDVTHINVTFALAR